MIVNKLRYLKKYLNSSEKAIISRCCKSLKTYFAENNLININYCARSLKLYEYVLNICQEKKLLLHAAIRFGYQKYFKKLYDSIDKSNIKGMNLLIIALEAKNIDMLKLLNNLNCKPNWEIGRYIGYDSVCTKYVCEEILSKNPFLYKIVKGNERPTINAVKTGNVEILKYLYDEGFRVNIANGIL